MPPPATHLTMRHPHLSHVVIKSRWVYTGFFEGHNHHQLTQGLIDYATRTRLHVGNETNVTTNHANPGGFEPMINAKPCTKPITLNPASCYPCLNFYYITLFFVCHYCVSQSFAFFL